MLLKMTQDEYNASRRQYLTSHALAEFRRCPYVYWQKKIGQLSSADSNAFAFGRAAHVLVLEGDKRFTEEFVVGGQVNPKTGKPFGPTTKAHLEWAAQQAKPVITNEDMNLLLTMSASVKNHKLASTLLLKGEAEAVIRAKYNGIQCQCRVDWMSNARETIVDLKTCDDLSYFESDLRKYGYMHQMAFYQSVAAADNCICDVFLVAVEKQAPYRCGVWNLMSETLATARAENEQAMRELMEAEQTGQWPTRYEEVRML